MTSRTKRLATAVLLAPALYWSATQAMILNSVRDISTSHGCLVWWRFDHTGFLLSMGPRAIPILKARVDDPGLALGHKIHLAWVLCRLGDTSRFPVFLDGLASDTEANRYIAVVGMRDFPEQCQRWLPEIVSQAKHKQNSLYWSLLHTLAQEKGLPEKRTDKIHEAISDSMFSEEPLDSSQIASLQRLFEA